MRNREPSCSVMTSLLSFEALDSRRILPSANSSSLRMSLDITECMSATMARCVPARCFFLAEDAGDFCSFFHAASAASMRLFIAPGLYLASL